jgi:hypothetical protein
MKQQQEQHPVDSLGCLEFWREVSQSSDGFDWLANHKPYVRSCELQELPLALENYNSYITLSTADKPAEDDLLNLKNVSIFFIDLRARGMLK